MPSQMLMRLLREPLLELESQLPELKDRRDSAPIANDIFEAAVYWSQLGRWAFEGNTKVNYPARARGEKELLAKLRETIETKSGEDKVRYSHLLEVAGKILRIVENVPLPKDGHLGFLRIIHERFRFLTSDYGFRIVDEEPTQCRLSSGFTYVDLNWATNSSMSFSFGADGTEKTFWIEDLLYLFGDERYRTIPQQMDLETESKVDRWFSFVASVLRQHGHALLSNSSGALKGLEEAQMNRDAEYAEEMERLHGNRD